jgi:hypothetical protein
LNRVSSCPSFPDMGELIYVFKGHHALFSKLLASPAIGYCDFRRRINRVERFNITKTLAAMEEIEMINGNEEVPEHIPEDQEIPDVENAKSPRIAAGPPGPKKRSRQFRGRQIQMMAISPFPVFPFSS